MIRLQDNFSHDAVFHFLSKSMLVEVNVGAPSVRLEWKCDEGIILLTPGFEEGNVLLGVVAGVFVLFAALLSGALG